MLCLFVTDSVDIRDTAVLALRWLVGWHCLLAVFVYFIGHLLLYVNIHVVCT